MALRTRTELLADFADNSTEDIQAQNHRDFVESVLVYGHIGVSSGSIGTGATPSQIEFDESEFAYGMTADLAGNEFANIEEGHYRVSVDFDVDLTGNNNLYTFFMYADDVQLADGFSWDTRLDGSRLTKTFVFPATLSNDLNTLDLRVTSSSAGTMTINNIDWIMERMGSA